MNPPAKIRFARRLTDNAYAIKTLGQRAVLTLERLFADFAFAIAASGGDGRLESISTSRAANFPEESARHSQLRAIYGLK